ncbi:hypothetical protein C7458_12027 [Williamsia muralis]|nr:hypothetical protein C7458_12027 [Williamsia marianensis]
MSQSAADRLRAQATAARAAAESKTRPNQGGPTAATPVTADSGGDTAPAPAVTDEPRRATTPNATSPTKSQKQPQRADPKPEQRTDDPSVRTPRQTAIKKTVVLAPTTNSKLGEWLNRTADELGLARVTAQQAMESLVDELLDNPDLARQIKMRIAREN